MILLLPRYFPVDCRFSAGYSLFMSNGNNGDDMSLSDNTLASIISWTPAGGMEVASWGTTYERGAAGFDSLYIVRRRVNGRWTYGLAWHADRSSVIKSLDRMVSRTGDCSAWPWCHTVADAVTWFATRKAAFSAAATA